MSISWISIILFGLLAAALSACSSSDGGGGNTNSNSRPGVIRSDTEIDSSTEEVWVGEGIPPPRVEDLSTLSYRSLSDTDLFGEISLIEPIALVGLKSPLLDRGVFRGQVLLTDGERQSAEAAVRSLSGIALQRLPDGLPQVQGPLSGR